MMKVDENSSYRQRNYPKLTLKVTKKPGFQPLFRRYIFRKASSLPCSLLGLSVFFRTLVYYW